MTLRIDERPEGLHLVAVCDGWDGLGTHRDPERRYTYTVTEEVPADAHEARELLASYGWGFGAVRYPDGTPPDEAHMCPDCLRVLDDYLDRLGGAV